MKTYKNNFLSKSLVACALTLAVSGAANATSGLYDVGFTTVADVNIIETTSINFGANMYTAAGGTCSMDASNPDDAVDFTIGGLLYVSGAGLTGANFGDISGTGCVTQTGGANGNTPGIFILSGFSGASVDLTVTGVDAGDWIYTPNSNCVGTYDGAAALLDTCSSFLPAVQVTVTLADTATDTDVQDGALAMAIGGKIDVVNLLTASTAFTAQYTVDATY